MAGEKTVKVIDKTGPTGFVFFLVFIGAAIYFISQATDFWGVVVGFLKACVWPVLLTLEVFERLNL